MAYGSDKERISVNDAVAPSGWMIDAYQLEHDAAGGWRLVHGRHSLVDWPSDWLPPALVFRLTAERVRRETGRAVGWHVMGGLTGRVTIYRPVAVRGGSGVLRPRARLCG